jgi:DNA primase
MSVKSRQMAGDTVQEIKSKLTIQDVVAPYVKLKRAGRSLTGLCPFHKEKTPSFHVSLERGTFHCFGCGEGGDMFTFIEKVEGVDFKGAMKLLAEKAGVEIVYDPRSKERSDKLDRLREAVARAGQWYAAKLTGTEALAYAKKRGLTADSIKTWGLGYAPDEWRALLEHLSSEGFSVQELLAAGLVKEADGKPGTYYDRFRNRLMFPIRDSSGRIVAFTGRALAADEQAKYLNSPESELYHKSEILYGLDRAKDAIRTRGFVMLVEGQMDVIHAHQAGFENAVALSGTALTGKHVAIMKRYSENLMLVLDMDQAGLAATAKSAQLALAEGMRVKAARLEGGKDPADLIASGPDGAKEFARCVKEAKPVVEFFLTVLGERERDPHRLVALAERIVLPLIRAVQSPMEREHFVQGAARALGLSPEAVRETLGKAKPAEAETSRTPRPAPAPQVSRGDVLRAAMHAYPDSALAKRIEAEYNRITGVHPVSLEAPPESVLLIAEQMFGEEPSEGAADELLSAFEEAVVREAYQEEVRALRRAEAAGDAAAVARAQAGCAELSARLARLGR